MVPIEWLVRLIWLAGAGQLVLCVASLAIPRVLGWREQLAHVNPLTRQMFHVYAVYIWGTNLSFGLVSLLAPGWLADGSGLSLAVDAFIAVYWGARVVIQFTYFDRSSAPSGGICTLAEAGLVLLFVYLTAVYGLAAARPLLPPA